MAFEFRFGVKMASITWHNLTLVIFVNIVTILLFIICVGSQDAAKPWYESLPAVAMDYKVHIDAGKEDCYFQYVQPGATFYVSFQVNNINNLVTNENIKKFVTFFQFF